MGPTRRQQRLRNTAEDGGAKWYVAVSWDRRRRDYVWQGLTRALATGRRSFLLSKLLGWPPGIRTPHGTFMAQVTVPGCPNLMRDRCLYSDTSIQGERQGNTRRSPSGCLVFFSLFRTHPYRRVRPQPLRPAALQESQQPALRWSASTRRCCRRSAKQCE